MAVTYFVCGRYKVCEKDINCVKCALLQTYKKKARAYSTKHRQRIIIQIVHSVISCESSKGTKPSGKTISDRFNFDYSFELIEVEQLNKVVVRFWKLLVVFW